MLYRKSRESYLCILALATVTLIHNLAYSSPDEQLSAFMDLQTSSMRVLQDHRSTFSLTYTHEDPEELASAERSGVRVKRTCHVCWSGPEFYLHSTASYNEPPSLKHALSSYSQGLPESGPIIMERDLETWAYRAGEKSQTARLVQIFALAKSGDVLTSGLLIKASATGEDEIPAEWKNLSDYVLGGVVASINRQGLQVIRTSPADLHVAGENIGLYQGRLKRDIEAHFSSGLLRHMRQWVPETGELMVELRSTGELNLGKGFIVARNTDFTVQFGQTPSARYIPITIKIDEAGANNCSELADQILSKMAEPGVQQSLKTRDFIDVGDGELYSRLIRLSEGNVTSTSPKVIR